MRIQLLVAVFVFCLHNAPAQIKVYPVKVGEIPNKVLPNEAMYTLPAFVKGTVLLRDGTSSTYLFNYNFLLDEMHFIAERGDTLAIAEPLLISFVVIDSTLFYYDKGYMEVVLKIGNYKLAVKQEMVLIADKTRGGYDATSGSSAIKTYGTITSGNSMMYRLQVQKDVLFQKENSFYIADASNHFLRANKKNFYTVFGEKRMSGYLKEYKVNFNNEEDLKALMRVCLQ